MVEEGGRVEVGPEAELDGADRFVLLDQGVLGGCESLRCLERGRWHELECLLALSVFDSQICEAVSGRRRGARAPLPGSGSVAVPLADSRRLEPLC